MTTTNPHTKSITIEEESCNEINYCNVNNVAEKHPSNGMVPSSLQTASEFTVDSYFNTNLKHDYFIDWNDIDPNSNTSIHDTESLFTVVRRIRNQFERDGFICCKNVVRNIEEWSFEYYRCDDNQQQQQTTQHFQRERETTDQQDTSVTCPINSRSINNPQSTKVISKKWYNLLNDHEEFFHDIFITLYAYEHTPFPQHSQSKDINATSVESGHTVGTNNVASPLPQDPSSTNTIIDYALGIGIKNGFREIVMRSPGRYEVSLWNDVLSAPSCRESSCHHNKDKASDIHESSTSDDSIAMLPFLADLKQQLWFVPNLLATKQQQQQLLESERFVTWDDVRIINVSFVVATPFCTEQAWHADGGHINLQDHEPCHVLNVFIPLCTLSADIGPTELRPGSHYYTRDLTKLLLLAKIKKTIRPTVTPLLDIGDILIFDYRILHRGQANISKLNKTRTYLVITVAQKWFHDRLNFPKRSLFFCKKRNVKQIL